MMNPKKVRTGAQINAYLLLRRQDQVLLSLRKNTGYFDGLYGLVSGHVEDGEAAISAMIREAYEEAGIRITPSSLKVVHVMHRKSDRLNMDLFFESYDWQGDIVNRESEKCAALVFFPLKKLPSNTIDYISHVIQTIGSQNVYSEHGWST